MDKKQIIKLIQGYLEQREKAQEFSKYMENYLDGRFVAKETILDEVVYNLIEEQLGDYCWDTIYQFVDEGYGWDADTKDLVEIGYYEPCSDGKSFRIKNDKKELVNKVKSYKEFRTFESWIEYNRPELK